MVRLRPTRAVRALTFEEKTRVANLFMLLIEVNQKKDVTRKRRSPVSASKPSHKALADRQTKAVQRESQKAKRNPANESPFCSLRVKKVKSHTSASA